MTQPVAILAQHYSPIWASSRYRAYWLEDTAPDLFKVYKPGEEESLVNHKVLVFQKRQSERDLMVAKLAKEKGLKVVYDLTDPLWWFIPHLVEPMLALADAVTVSSEGLWHELGPRMEDQGKSLWFIPDRMKPDYHPTTAEHGEHNPVALCWYGIAQNRGALAGWMPVLEYLKHKGAEFTLRVIDEKSTEPLGLGQGQSPYPIEYVPWALESFHAQVSACDIALLPPYPGPWGVLKSNNKQVTAYWCGLPVVDDWDLTRLRDLILDPELRKTEGKANREKAEAEYDIARSVEQWITALERLGVKHGR